MSSPHGKPAKRTVEVSLLGQRMTLKAEHDPQHVERLAAHVKRKVEELGPMGPVSATKLALLAAINIADDYFRAADASKTFKREVAARSRALLEELEG